MNTFKTMGLLGIMSLLLLTTACKKNPNKALYSSWTLTSASMTNIDQTTVDAMIDAGVVYTFNKEGAFSFTSGDETVSGTFETDKNATEITTTVDGDVEVYHMVLSEDKLTLSKGSESMTFLAQK